MKLYNTRTRKTEELQPLEDKHVRMYSCGPTVYDHAHIGNLSAYIFADTLRRVIQQVANCRVTHAMNYTDVDDKTIRRSRERYPDMAPRKALHKLTGEYIKLFLSDMEKIGNDTHALTFLRATDQTIIAGMHELIEKLYEGGFAYIADDGVYFSIEAYRKSGKTYGQLLELTLENTSEQRIQNDEYDKASVHDFALWKMQKDNEPAWPFTLDGHDLTGRPGWHIECSVMSRSALGQPFDIHTGGVDLIFPHHENEIAQSTAGEMSPVMATIFAHNEHILVDGKKMSKSAKNFYTLQDIIDRGYDPLAFRLLVLQGHYRNQVNFTWESLDAAQNRLRRWRQLADLRFQVVQPDQFLDKLPASIEANNPYTKLGAQAVSEFKDAMLDDLDTPRAIVAVELLMDAMEREGMLSFLLPGLTTLLQQINWVLGINLFGEDIGKRQKQLIARREKAREAKGWALSDELRGRLQQQGIGLRDTPYGTVWYRI